MAVENDAYTLLAALVSNRAFPMVAPEGTATPYITYQVISNIPVVCLDGITGTENRRFQIDGWADSYAAAKTLESSIKAAFAASVTIVNVPLSTMDGYEPETKLYRVTMDYSVWSS